jgi:hypothetical protein
MSQVVRHQRGTTRRGSPGVRVSCGRRSRPKPSVPTTFLHEPPWFVSSFPPRPWAPPFITGSVARTDPVMERRRPTGAEEIIKEEECLLQMEERLIMVDVLGIANAQKQGLARARTGAYVQKVSVWGGVRVVYLPLECVIMIVVVDCVNLSDLVFVVLKYLLVFIHS